METDVERRAYLEVGFARIATLLPGFLRSLLEVEPARAWPSVGHADFRFETGSETRDGDAALSSRVHKVRPWGRRLNSAVDSKEWVGLSWSCYR